MWKSAFNDRAVLPDAGSVSREQADSKAESEYEKFSHRRREAIELQAEQDLIRDLESIAAGKDRLLLTLATGTGKTFIAFQLAWKLFQSRWNLADQAFNAFSAFLDDAVVRIAPDEIKKKGRVPKNGSLFFTIFQTFMCGPTKDGEPSPWFGDYPPDYFDFIVIDEHALAVRDLINQIKTSRDPNYCVRVTADDGSRGDAFLREFQDNEKTIPTILTTSQKLSTGVDARNVRNIVLMRPINSMIEFKQIIGRGTRLFDGKDYFTIYDFVKAHHHFSVPEWDAPPDDPDTCDTCGQSPCVCEKPEPKPCPNYSRRPCECLREPCEVCGQVKCVCERKPRAKVKLADGKEHQIQHMMVTSFWYPGGTPMSSQQFMYTSRGEE